MASSPLATFLFVTSAAMVTGAAAECWTRSDGVRVCSTEPAEWLAVWWFWFALLLLAVLLTGCWDSLRCPPSSTSTSTSKAASDESIADAKADVVAIAVTDGFPTAAFKEPLLEQPQPGAHAPAGPTGQPPRHSSLKKPVYRYL